MYDEQAWYQVDWSKIDSLDKIVALLKALDPRFTESHIEFQNIKHLLVKTESTFLVIPVGMDGVERADN